jgi:hypothetical protein
MSKFKEGKMPHLMRFIIKVDHQQKHNKQMKYKLLTGPLESKPVSSCPHHMDDISVDDNLQGHIHYLGQWSAMGAHDHYHMHLDKLHMPFVPYERPSAKS